MTDTFTCPSCTTIDGSQHLHHCEGLEGLSAPLVEEGSKARHVLVPREDYTLGDILSTPYMACRTDHWDGSNDCTVYAPTSKMALFPVPPGGLNRSQRDISVTADLAIMGSRAHHKFNDPKLGRMAEVARRLESTMLWSSTSPASAGNAYYLFALGTGTGKPGGGTPDAFRVALFQNAVTPVQSTTAALTQYAGASSTWSTTNEITNTSGTAYTAGGLYMSSTPAAPGGTTNCTWTQATNVVTFTSTGTPTWGPPASFTAYGGLIYDATTSSQAISWNYFGGAQTVTSGTFSITWNVSGILTLTC